jgi:hypothetical protein
MGVDTVYMELPAVLGIGLATLGVGVLVSG